MTKVRVAIVDDHEIVRESLRRFLVDFEDFEWVAECGDGKEALDLLRQHPVDVLLLDLSMPGFNGFDAIASLRARSPETSILVFSGLPEENYALSLIRRGAAGFVSKNCHPEELAAAIRTVANGRRYLSPLVANLMLEEVLRPQCGPPHTALGPRELQVFIRLAKGETVSQIGKALSLSARTVGTYRHDVMIKLAVTNSSELTYYAFKHKLIN